MLDGDGTAPSMSEGIIMSYVAPASSHRSTAKVTRFTALMRRSWNEARLVDRRLMEMRTELSRHSG
jgi:hypothetical protein